jgi:hypothetical protein
MVRAAAGKAEGARLLQRFQNCYTPEPRLQSGIFLKKMPPFTTFKSALEF